MTFRKAGLRNKLLTFGIFISVVSMSSGLLLSFLSLKKMGDVASEECLKLGFSDLDHIVENVHAMSIAQNGLAQTLIGNALKTARSQLYDTGKVNFSRENTVTWDAINQFTKKSERIAFPKMMVGDQWLGQNR